MVNPRGCGIVRTPGDKAGDRVGLYKFIARVVYRRDVTRGYDSRGCTGVLLPNSRQARV